MVTITTRPTPHARASRQSAYLRRRLLVISSTVIALALPLRATARVKGSPSPSPVSVPTKSSKPARSADQTLAPLTEAEIVAARSALCRAARENPERAQGNMSGLATRATEIYQTTTGERDRTRALRVTAAQFSALAMHEWSLDSCEK